MVMIDKEKLRAALFVKAQGSQDEFNESRAVALDAYNKGFLAGEYFALVTLVTEIDNGEYDA